MSDMFSLDDREIKDMTKQIALQGRSTVFRVQADVLDRQAFESRSYAQKRAIPDMFHNRSKWVASSILVDKANTRDKKKMFSVFGAARRWGKNPSKDFWGMRDQELGSRLRKPQIMVNIARSGGAFPGKVSTALRKGLGSSMPNETQYTGHGTSRVVSMLRQLDRQNYKGLIHVKKKVKGFKQGVYKFARDKFKTPGDWTAKSTRNIKMITDQSQSSVKLKKKAWMAKSVKKSVTKAKLKKFFKQSYQRRIKTGPRL